MSISWKEFVSGFAGSGTAASAYTVPVETTATIQNASVSNSTADAVVSEIYIVPAAGSADDTTRVSKRTVAPDGVLSLFDLVNAKLEAGSSIYVLGNGLYFNISGAENVAD